MQVTSYVYDKLDIYNDDKTKFEVTVLIYKIVTYGSQCSINEYSSYHCNKSKYQACYGCLILHKVA